MTRLTISMMVLIGCVSTSAVALASPVGSWRGDGMTWMHGVSLSDVQKGQVHQIALAGEAQMHATMKQMHVVHDQMSKLMMSGATIDELTPLMRREEALRDAMDAQHLALAVQMRNVLTAQQLAAAASQEAKLASLREQEHAIMHGDAPD